MESETRFFDWTRHPRLRTSLLGDEPTILLVDGMTRIGWANPAGAALFGGAGIGPLLESRISPTQPLMRQFIAAASHVVPGKPITRGFRVSRGGRMDFIQCELERLETDGPGPAIRICVPAEKRARADRDANARRAIEGLGGLVAGAAILDVDAGVVAADAAFERLAADAPALAALVRDASLAADGTAETTVAADDGQGVRLTAIALQDAPARYLVRVAATEEAPAAAPADMEAPAAAPADLGDESSEAEGPPPWDGYDKASLEEAGSWLEDGPLDAAADGEPEHDRRDDRAAGGYDAPGEEPEQGMAEAHWTGERPGERPGERTGERLGESPEALPEAPAGRPDEEPAGESARPEDRPGGVRSLLERWYANRSRPEPEADGNDVDPGAQADAGPRDGDRDDDDGRPEPAGFVFAAADEPVRFAWTIDADGIFRSVSAELGQTVGPAAADIVGRHWRDVAGVLGFDTSGEIGGLLERRDTWSGKCVLWPVQGTDLAVPIDLAALPAFSSSREFDGFRGFGIIRAADAVVDPRETGLALARLEAAIAEEPDVPRRQRRDMEDEDAPDAVRSSNVVDIASRKRAAGDGEADEGLSGRDLRVFREIGRKLGNEEEAEADEPEPAPRSLEEPDGQRPRRRDDRPAAPSRHLAPGTILDELRIPVIVYRGDGPLYANRELFAVTGFKSVEAIDAAGGVEALISVDDMAEGQNPVMTLTCASGRTMPVSPLLQTIRWGDDKALLLTFRHAAGEQAAESRAAVDMARVSELETILDTATDGIIVADRDGMIESVNASAEALFGITYDTARGRPMTDLFARESFKTITEYMEELAQPGVAGILNDGREVIGLEAKGGLIPLFITIGRLGESEKHCAVLRDITQWKKAEEELIGARRAAESASEQKTDFLARVSHEIRTPLNAIIGFSDVMIEERFGPIDNERYREYLRDINRSGVHVLDLINDLLDISKIEAGKMELSYEAVDLNQIVSESVALLQPQANGERIIIRTSLSRAVPRVVADVRSMRQIILNLVSNAIKFTPMNGQVIVSTVYEGNGEVVMRVRDTGRGMSASEIETAMKPFSQINLMQEKRSQGTGLGLPLTKALVEANRAYFDLESTPGEGTIAHVHFPIQRVLAD